MLKAHGYNQFMRHNISVDQIKFPCINFIALLILASCASPTKDSQLSILQRQRIQNLERTVAQQETMISQLKAKNWVAEPVVPAEELAFRKLRHLLAEKKWGAALRESAQLKKTYPKSIRLHTYRYKIFRKIGLENQARQERESLRRLMVGRAPKADVL